MSGFNVLWRVATEIQGFLTHPKAQLAQHVFQEWSYVEVLFGFDEG